jgi:hypothetical protein
MTLRYEEVEMVLKKKDPLYRDPTLLSELSQSRIKDKAKIPSQLEKGKIRLAGIKKYFPLTDQIEQVIGEQFPDLSKLSQGTYFVEA